MRLGQRMAQGRDPSPGVGSQNGRQADSSKVISGVETPKRRSLTPYDEIDKGGLKGK